MPPYETQDSLEEVLFKFRDDPIQFEGRYLIDIPKDADLEAIKSYLHNFFRPGLTKDGTMRKGIIINLGGAPASGKTTTAEEFAEFFEFIRCPYKIIKFPTRGKRLGDMLHSSLNYVEGTPNQELKKGYNVLGRIESVNRDKGYVKIYLPGFDRHAVARIPENWLGKFEKFDKAIMKYRGIDPDYYLEDNLEMESKGKDLRREVFKEGNKLVFRVLSVGNVPEVVPRRWQKSTFLKDSGLMIGNYIENRTWIKKLVDAGYFVILDRGSELELAAAPPRWVNSYLGQWLENQLSKLTNVGPKYNIYHNADVRDLIERIAKRKEAGTAIEQPYERLSKLRSIGGNLKSMYTRRKHKADSDSRIDQRSHEEFARDLKEKTGIDIVVGRDPDGVSAQIDTSENNEELEDLLEDEDTKRFRKKVAKITGLVAGLAAAIYAFLDR